MFSPEIGFYVKNPILKGARFPHSLGTFTLTCLMHTLLYKKEPATSVT